MPIPIVEPETIEQHLVEFNNSLNKIRQPDMQAAFLIGKLYAQMGENAMLFQVVMENYRAASTIMCQHAGLGVLSGFILCFESFRLQHLKDDTSILDSLERL